VLQIRVISPADLTPTVLERLTADHGTANLSVQLGAAVEPAGDVIIVEIARERGNAVIDTLVDLKVDERGSISLLALEAHTSRRGSIAEEAAAGHGADALMWEELEERAHADAIGTVTFYALMVVAALIAAIAIIIDSAVLVIGAMIVGPEYGPLTALAVSAYRRKPDTKRAAMTLLGGLTLGIAAAALLTLVVDRLSEIGASFHSGGNFFTSFVSEPNVYSFIVAFLAGIAGTVALAQSRQAALAGVLVSVTTIPAAAAVGVNAAVAEWSDAAGALAQLAINLVALLLASVATLWVHDRAWRQVMFRRSVPRAPSR
jgi:uncharacterized hydrophobic protein (TIGR00271 family)